MPEKSLGDCILNELISICNKESCHECQKPLKDFCEWISNNDNEYFEAYRYSSAINEIVEV